MSLTPSFSIFLCATSLGLLLTPVAVRAASLLGIGDSPDGSRKIQGEVVALGGGLVVAGATALAILLGRLLEWFPPGQFSGDFLARLLPGILLLLLVGIIDDIYRIRGVTKLAGQCFASGLLILSGLCFESISLFGMEFVLGPLAVPFTLFFYLGAINAFNLLDGADGLVASIGVVVCLTLGGIAASRGSVESALLCFSFSGALVGFLRYNAPPASIYLGDTGSMLIGFIVAAVAIQSSIKSQAAMALVVPVTICAIPILDASAALVRRWMTGQSIFAGDRGHLHHALLHRGWTARQTVGFITGLTAVTCGGALISYFFHSDWIAVLVTLMVFAALAAARIFGHAELALISSHARSVARVLVLGRLPGGPRETQQTVHLQGDRRWEKLWQALLEFAEDYNLAGIRLNLNIPRWHESYYGNWRSPRNLDKENLWQVSLPLRHGDKTIGKLSLLGDSSQGNGFVAVHQALDFLEPLEENIVCLLEERGLQAKTSSLQSTVPLAPAGKSELA